MATARSNIPHGSILSQLRQRQLDEYNAAEEKKKKKAAFTNQMIQLGGMAVGAALAAPTGGLSLMAGAGLGGTAGGLLGNAATGTPVSMNQGINAAMQVGGLMDRQARTDIGGQRDAMYAANQGYQPVQGAGAMQDLNLEGSMMLGRQEYAKPYMEDTIQTQAAQARALAQKYGADMTVDFGNGMKGKFPGADMSGGARGGGGNIGEGAAAARVGGGGVIDSLGGTPRTPFDYSRQGNVVEPYYKRDLLPVRGSGVGQPSGSLAAVQNTQDTFGGGQVEPNALQEAVEVLKQQGLPASQANILWYLQSTGSI